MSDSQPSRPAIVPFPEDEETSSSQPQSAKTETVQVEEAISSKCLGVLCVLIFVGTSAFVFRGAWNPSNTIEGADIVLGFPMFVQKWTHLLFVPRWYPYFLAGIAQQFQFLSHSLPLMLALPPHRFYGFLFMLDTFLAGAFMFAFLRDRRIGYFGAIVGGLAFQLSSGLLTSAAQGFAWKFDTVCWVPLFLLFFLRILNDRPQKLKNSIFAGAALGMQFLGGEIQLAYYVCLLAFAYFVVHTIYSLWNARVFGSLAPELKAVRTRLLWAALAVMVSAIFSAEILSSYVSYAGRNENVGVQTEQDNWRFATEFSFPPKETPSLFFTGSAFGSGVQLNRGQIIFRNSDDYLGIAVLLFAFLGLFSNRRQKWFFACAAGLALLISFGKYFPPPYRLIYLLPAMKGLRNPHKWLFITSLCISILAGMGADAWKNEPSTRNRKMATIIISFVFVACLFATAAFLFRNRISTVIDSSSLALHVGNLLLVAGICILARTKGISRMAAGRFALAGAVVALLAIDLIGNAEKYISYNDYRNLYVEDKLVQWIGEQTGPFRVKLWSESPYLREVVTKVLPYKEIDSVDVIMSRRPRRYSDVFQALRENRLPLEKFFQLFNVKYILSAAAIQNVSIPLNEVVTFQPEGLPTLTCYVYECGNSLARAYLAENYEVVAADKVLSTMGDPNVDLRKTVILEEDPALAAGMSAKPLEWNIDAFSTSPHRVGMRIETSRTAMLVLDDLFDEHWHAYVDGEEATMLRANYLMRAVAVPEGMHFVSFRYKPPVFGFALTLVGWIFLALFILSVILFKFFKSGGNAKSSVKFTP
jgi:hypothetical protein